MNPVTKKFKPLINSLDNLINKIKPSQVKIIKQLYYLFIFLLIVVGILIGTRRGKDSAGIYLPPLVDGINDAFDIKLRQERGGNFESILESETIAGQKSSPSSKIPFAAQEPLQMEYEGGIVDYPTSRQRPAEMEFNATPIEGKYATPMGRPEPQVKPLERTQNPVEADTRLPLPSERTAPSAPSDIRPLKDGDIMKNNSPIDDVPVTEKRSPSQNESSGGTEKQNITPMRDNTGIIDVR